MINISQKIRFTENAFVDSGLTVLMLHAGVRQLDELTEEHINSFIEWAVRIYLTSAMAGFLTFVIFPNASFANPAQINKEEYRPKREKILRDVFNLWRWTPDEPFPDTEERAFPTERCVFSGDPAVVRISQTLMPMIGGRDAINFFPQGRPKLPVSGWCLLALLAMPMATLNASGRAFLPFTYDPKVRRALLRKNWERNKKDFLNQSLEKRPNYNFPRTQLMGDLLDIIDHLHAYNGQALDEAHVTTMLEEIYHDHQIAAQWQKDYDTTRRDFSSAILDTMIPFESADIAQMKKFYELFDGVDVLPAELANLYSDTREKEGFLSASQYAVNINWGQYCMLKTQKLIRVADEGDYLDQVFVTYDREAGLQFNKPLKSTTPSNTFLIPDDDL